VYQLTEQVRLGKGRVEAGRTIRADNPKGGYLLEIDARRGETFFWDTGRGVHFSLSDPDDGYDEAAAGEPSESWAGSSLFNKVKGDVQKLEDGLFEGDYSLLDIDSAIDWYLVNEIAKNNDSDFSSSCYVYYNADAKKFFFGPVWDFDIGFGNIGYNDGRYPEGWHTRNGPWFARLFGDTAFAERVKARYTEKRAQLGELSAFLEGQAAYLDKAQQSNFKKWNILSRIMWPNPVATGSYRGEVYYLRDWLKARLEWMDGEFSR
jgi:hypothetical protein